MPNRDVARITLVAAATLFGLWVLFRIRHVILLAGVAAFFAVALEPAVTSLQRLVRSRAVAVAVMMILVVLAVAGFIASVAPPIARQAESLIDDAPAHLDELSDASTTLGALESRFHVRDRLESALGNVTTILSNLGAIFGTVAGIVSNLLVVLALTLYFLASAPRMKREGLRLLPPRKRERTAAVMEVVFAKVGGWMEGNILVSIIAGAVSFVGLLLIGVPYPAALAMWVAITDLIPMVGALLGAFVCVVVAFFTGTGQGIATLAFFLVYQQIENYLIGPRVMKRTVDVSAVAVILAALIGGTLLGPIGVLLAVPAAASVKVLANELWLANRSREPAPP